MERKQHRLAEEEAWAGAEAEVTANDIPLYPVTSFRYLGRVLLAANDNWPLVFSNLWKTQWKWVQLARVMSRKGADAQT